MIRQLLFILMLTTTAFAAKESILMPNEENGEVAIANKLLAKVNGKPITVLDIAKKMDMVFYRQFPEYSYSPTAKHQFYNIAWKRILMEQIDKELILADAEEAGMQVSAGDVRQEIETIFGPNIFENLEKAGLSYEEAKSMVEGDIILRRMVQVRVNMQAQRKVTPDAARNAYQEMTDDMTRPAEWLYQVISVRGDADQKVKQKAEQVHRDLTKGLTSLDTLKEQYSEEFAAVSASEEYRHTEKDIADAYRKILNEMTPGEISQPLAQKSRSGKGALYRIFILRDKTTSGKMPFSEVEAKIHSKLVDQAVAEETEKYLKKLRVHFDVDDTPFKAASESGKELFTLVKK